MKKSFSPEQRNEILKYVDEFNKSKGRGGLSAASKKYKVSVPSIINWQKKGLKATKKGTKSKAEKEIKTVIRKKKTGKIINNKLSAIYLALESIKDGVAALEDALKKLN